MKIDWLRIERTTRSALRTARSYVDNPSATPGDLVLLLQEISEVLGEETGRGYEIEGDALLQRFGGAT